MNLVVDTPKIRDPPVFAFCVLGTMLAGSDAEDTCGHMGLDVYCTD